MWIILYNMYTSSVWWILAPFSNKRDITFEWPLQIACKRDVYPTYRNNIYIYIYIYIYIIYSNHNKIILYIAIIHVDDCIDVIIYVDWNNCIPCLYDEYLPHSPTEEIQHPYDLQQKHSEVMKAHPIITITYIHVWK